MVIMKLLHLLSFLLKFSITAALSKKVTLLTFDVDGTLVQGSTQAAQVSAHARAFGFAVGKVFGNVDDWHIKVPSPPMVIPPERYHGSTDGIVALNLARFGFNVDPVESFPKLNEVFNEMYQYVAALPDEEVARGIEVFPGVLQQLRNIANSEEYKNGNILCGLVTGNVEGIARKKMRAVGILGTNVLSRKADEQNWKGEDEHAFLGGFGSCYCGGDIDDLSKMYKDRGEQILIAVRRAKSLLSHDQQLVRVVHIGDSPSDVLAAKYCVDDGRLSKEGIVVGLVAVATGKFSAEELKNLCGPPLNGWDPCVLEKGVADPNFIKCCKITS
jgi:phosphoglycolate phosphatase-like HAD superfamily hydrolase